MHKLSRVIFLDPLFIYFILSLQGLLYMEIWIPPAINVRTHYVLLHHSTENRPDDKWLPTWLLQFLENLDVYPGSSYHYFSAFDRKIDNIRFGSTCLTVKVTRIIQSLYYSPTSRCINAWMHSLKKSVKPEIVNRYYLWVLRHKIGGAEVFVNNVQWSDQMMQCCMQYTYSDKYNQTWNKT